MFCSHCGKELAEDAFMCPNCGSPVQKAAGAKKPSPQTQEGGKETALSIVGFVFAMIAFVTAIIYGSFFYVYIGSVVLLYVLGAFTILPAFVALFIGIYTLVSLRGKENVLAKNLSITAVVFAGFALFFLFIAGCVIASSMSMYYY